MLSEINQCHIGDCREILRSLPEQIAQCCVTSPPYFGLRDYGMPGQLGQEKTPEEYVENMVQVLQGVRRVLRDDGTLWLNLGDSYSTGSGGANGGTASTLDGKTRGATWQAGNKGRNQLPGIPPKNLLLIPSRVALALQADGWYLRSDIVWHKPNPMPESVTDRPTRSHEFIFLLSKSERYFYDAAAIREPAEFRTDARPFGNAGGNRHGDEERVYKPHHDSTEARKARAREGIKSNPTESKNGIRPPSMYRADKQRGHTRRHAGFNDRWDGMSKTEQAEMGRNKRDVWTVATVPYEGAHFAVFPPDLIKPCILAGTRGGDTVLDPFFGSGTTGEVAQALGRNWIGCELNPAYGKLQAQRTAQTGMVL